MTVMIAATGSRKFVPTPKLEDATRRTIKALKGDDLDLVLMSGMAEGYDEFVARMAVANGTFWEAVVPNGGYGSYYWGRNSLSGKNRMSEFTELMGKAENIHFVCRGIYATQTEKEFLGLAHKGQLHANFARNQYMANQADAFLVYHVAGSHGTEDMLKRIIASGKPYALIDEEKILRPVTK